MAITLIKSTILSKVRAEVSHVADMAYAENGASLYDAVALTSKDDDLVKSFVDDAAIMLATANSDIAIATIGADTDVINFSAPGLPSGMEAVVTNAAERFAVMYASNGILQQRKAAVSPEYSRRTQEALDNVNRLIRARRPVIRNTAF